MGTSTLTGLITLTHELWFSEDKLKAMVAEAVSICNNTRIANRRNEMAEKKIPLPEPVKTNETLFGGDLDFVEAVLIDKFQFRKLMYSIIETEIEPTIKI